MTMMRRKEPVVEMRRGKSKKNDNQLEEERG